MELDTVSLLEMHFFFINIQVFILLQIKDIIGDEENLLVWVQTYMSLSFILD